MERKHPDFLKKGDKIRIVSTARAVEKEFIDFASEELRQRGFQVELGENLFARSNQFAGEDAMRLKDLNDAVSDPECKAIFCARGGYGTTRLLRGFDLENFHSNPKWIVGYSDITALHFHIFNATGIQSIHGTMPVNYATNHPNALNSLFALLQGQSYDYHCEPHPLNQEGNAEGILVGGNLSVIYSLLGSKAQIDTTGKILFLEDLDEYLYHVDRMMLALDRAGMFENLNGLLIGGMTKMNDNIVPYGMNAEEIIADRLKEYNFPTYFNFPAGHIDENLAWIHGKKIRLSGKTGQPLRVNYL